MKERILKDIEIAKSKGYEIQPMFWVQAGSKTCCALGAVLIAECQTADPSEMTKLDFIHENEIKNLLGLSWNETSAFTTGFDGSYFDGDTNGEAAAFSLGREIRMECGFDPGPTLEESKAITAPREEPIFDWDDM